MPKLKSLEQLKEDVGLDDFEWRMDLCDTLIAQRDAVAAQQDPPMDGPEPDEPIEDHPLRYATDDDDCVAEALHDGGGVAAQQPPRSHPQAPSQATGAAVCQRCAGFVNVSHHFDCPVRHAERNERKPQGLPFEAVLPALRAGQKLQPVDGPTGQYLIRDGDDVYWVSEARKAALPCILTGKSLFVTKWQIIADSRTPGPGEPEGGKE